MLKKQVVFVVCAKEDIARAYPLLIELQKSGVQLVLDVDGERPVLLLAHRDAMVMNSACTLVYYSQAMLRSESCREAMDTALAASPETLLLVYPDEPEVPVNNVRAVYRKLCADDAAFAQQAMREISGLFMAQRYAQEQSQPREEPTWVDDLPSATGTNEAYLDRAIAMALEQGQISISMLRRRMAVGHSRAAQLIDEMEKMGIIAAGEGPKSRKTLMTREEYEKMKQ